jgi:hypothetical protein
MSSLYFISVLTGMHVIVDFCLVCSVCTCVYLFLYKPCVPEHKIISLLKTEFDGKSSHFLTVMLSLVPSLIIILR